ncbi:hypothetical protein JXA12_05275 [Candidatus Woesearchaeota archaeon]|nr:hypothetical protein [Candidatus Woesearchaeota archaeon]
MAQRCSLCKEKVGLTFLQKPLGTWVRDRKGKQHLVCQACQRRYSAAELKEKL